LEKEEKLSMTAIHPNRLGGSNERGWREVTAGKTDPREDETKRSPRKKKRRYTCRLFGTNILKEGAM
jgi:hypothetical protein